MGNAEQQGRLRSLLERSRTELLEMIGDAKPADAQPEGQQPNVEQA
jgi:hypothetical protein